MSQSVKLVGLDFGTTTCGAVVADARLTHNAVTGRIDLAEVRETFRSELEFTPLAAEGDGETRLNLARLERLLDDWLAAGNASPKSIFGGGALLTGLTAQRDNAPALVAAIRRRLADALVAVADDPCLESWMAFMGSAAPLSRMHPGKTFLNLDIGGGTTNLALGRAGEVLATGCLFVGARHVKVVPGTYRITALSRYAQVIFAELAIRKGPGDELCGDEVDALLAFQEQLLVAAAGGDETMLRSPLAEMHVQSPFHKPPGEAPIITLSGGVGELAYAALDGRPWPGRTHFGDLGVELAQRLVRRDDWREDLLAWRPASAGRATVYGLLRHNTQISGSTIYLPHPEMLPLAEIPILGSIDADSDDERLRNLFGLAARSTRGGCVYVSCGAGGAKAVRRMGERIRDTLQALPHSVSLALVLMMRENLGKALGQYASGWGMLPVRLIVLDQIERRDAQFARLGAMRDHVIPISFHGLRELGATP